MFERSSKCKSSSEKIHILWSRWTEAQGGVEQFIGENRESWAAKVETAHVELRRGEELNCKLNLMDASENAYAVFLFAGSNVVIKYNEFLTEQGEFVEAELLLEKILFRTVSDWPHVFTCIHRNRRQDTEVCCSHLANGSREVKWPDLSVHVWPTVDKSSYT